HTYPSTSSAYPPFFLQQSSDHRSLHSFPTRRSSDLTFNTVSQSNADTDLGSGGVLLLPDLADSGGQMRHLAVGAGKDSHIYVVEDRKSTRLNSSHLGISYAVFCLKKKKHKKNLTSFA